MKYSKIRPDLLFEIGVLESLPKLWVSELICRVEVESESSSEQHRILRNDRHCSEKWTFSSRFRSFPTFSICAIQSWKCRLRRWKFCPRWVGRDGTARCPRRIFLWIAQHIMPIFKMPYQIQFCQWLQSSRRPRFRMSLRSEPVVEMDDIEVWNCEIEIIPPENH